MDTVIKNYKRTRWVHNSKRLGKDDSLSIWFSMDDINAFLEQARLHGADGVRYYFGAYDEHYPEKPVHAGRQTVVMVATRQKQTLGGVTDKDIYVTNENGTSILAYNVGRPCPPLCNNGDDGIGIMIVDKGEDGLIVG